MKVKIGSEPVLGTPKVGTELVLRILRFEKFGTGTHCYLLISDHKFHMNNISNIQLFWLIFFRLFFTVFLQFLFILVSGSACNALVVISKHM
ncbi:hypothetical protein Hanom_Chr00s000003g01602871 [Helianthus anomalus]